MTSANSLDIKIPDFKTISVHVDQHIAHLQLNRPDSANAMNRILWQELGEAMVWADKTPAVRVVILSGKGKHFCSGIDLGMFTELMDDAITCEARKREALREEILWLQQQLTAIEACRKPVIAAIHGVCIGGGVDLISACDLRYCTEDATFSIKEIDIGMVADVGTLQRLPRLIGEGLMRELAYTGRDIRGKEAVVSGLSNQSFSSKDAMMTSVFELAKTIASKSPLSIRGTKQVLLYSREHSVSDGLNYIATWNAGMLMSNDIKTALKARQKSEAPRYEN